MAQTQGAPQSIRRADRARQVADVLRHQIHAGAYDDGYPTALFAGLADDDAAVRRTAADGARELVEVIPDPATARAQLGSPDPVVRACVVYLLSSRGVGDPTQYRAVLADPDHRVRVEAVRALVSVDDVAAVATAAGDGNREVRIAVANAMGTLRDGAGAVRLLVGDPDPAGAGGGAGRPRRSRLQR